MARVNRTITIVAGTPINVATGLSSAAMLAAGFTSIRQLQINRISIQMLIGGTGAGYVMDGIRGVTSTVQQWRVPDHTVSTDLTAQLAPASATAPGSQYSDANNSNGINIAECWIDGSVSGDKVQVSYDTRT